MNRAFLIILAPAFLVALLYLTMGWGWRVSLPAGAVTLVLAGVFFLLRRSARRGTSACVQVTVAPEGASDKRGKWQSDPRR